VGLKTLERCFEELRKLDAEMPMQTALALLFVHRMEEDGQDVYIKDVGAMLGMSTAAASRNISKLCKVGVKGSTGHGLVETFEDVQFRVRKHVRITPKGQRVVNTLKEILDEYKTSK
jgi:DNA-binding MarR family transcriptional regulator